MESRSPCAGIGSAQWSVPRRAYKPRARSNPIRPRGLHCMCAAEWPRANGRYAGRMQGHGAEATAMAPGRRARGAQRTTHRAGQAIAAKVTAGRRQRRRGASGGGCRNCHGGARNPRQQHSAEQRELESVSCITTRRNAVDSNRAIKRRAAQRRSLGGCGGATEPTHISKVLLLLPSEAGIVPVRRLLSKSNSVIAVRPPNELGIGPVK